MGFLVHGIEYAADGKIKGFPNYYLDTDDKGQAIAEALRRGTLKVTCEPIANRPPGYDAKTGYPIISRWLRVQLWLASIGTTLRLAWYVLLFVGLTAAVIIILAYCGVDSRSPGERQRHDRQIRDIQRGR